MSRLSTETIEALEGICRVPYLTGNIPNIRDLTIELLLRKILEVDYKEWGNVSEQYCEYWKENGRYKIVVDNGYGFVREDTLYFLEKVTKGRKRRLEKFVYLTRRGNAVIIRPREGRKSDAQG